MKLFFDDPEFDQQFARTVGKAAVGMADVGECFATASRMTAGDYRSWRDCWQATAERIEGIADQAANAGRRRSAGEAYLRAAEYHRASYFFDRVDLEGSFLRSTWQATRRSFRAGLDHLGVDVEDVAVPYEGTTLTGYLIRPEGAAAAPTRPW
jgi:hypothetical protein